MIYVCLDDLYNHTQGNELGYPFMSDFLAGWSWNIDSNDSTWQGNYEGNKSIGEVMETLYTSDYTYVWIQGFNVTNKVVEDIQSRIEYIMPHGYCLALNQTKDFKFLAVSNYERVKVVLVDPYSANKVVMKEGATTTFGPRAKDTRNEFLSSHAHFKIYDQACVVTLISRKKD